MILFRNHCHKKKSKLNLEQLIIGYARSWVVTLILYFLFCTSYFIFSINHEGDITTNNISDSIILFLIINVLILLKYNLFTISSVGFFLMFSYITKIFKYGMNSWLIVTFYSLLVFGFQLIILPIDKLTKYNASTLLKFYIVSIFTLTAIMTIYRLLFNKNYKSWLINNYKKYLTKNPLICKSTSGLENIICIVLPIIFILICFCL